MRRFAREFVTRVISAAVLAGILSTVAQVILWLCLTDSFPAILYRDTRMAAAILLGPEVLSADISWWTWCVASAIHFCLSSIYALVIVVLTFRTRLRRRLFVGAVSGAAIYFVNMYGFVSLFPWFIDSRDPITFVAHLVFGLAAAFDWVEFGRRR